MKFKEIVDQVLTAESMKVVWDEFSKKLIELGYEEYEMAAYVAKSDASRRKQNKNIYYVHPDRDFVFLFIYSPSLDEIYPVIMDKVDFFRISDGNKFFYFVKARHDSVHLPAVRKGKYLRKIHTVICETSDDFVVDHAAMSGSICTREMLRPATLQQNRIHTKYYSKVYEDYFEGTYSITDDIKEKMEEEGYRFSLIRKRKINSYRVRSPKYSDKETLCKNLEECEKAFLGNFRYNPIKACECEEEVFLYFCKKAMGWSEEDYVPAKKYLLERTDKDAAKLFWYYNI